jgi:hypothetical protein
MQSAAGREFRATLGLSILALTFRPHPPSGPSRTLSSTISAHLGASARNNLISCTVKITSMMVNTVTPVRLSLREFVHSKCGVCGANASQIDIDRSDQTTVALRACAHGHTERYLCDRETAVPPCPSCGGALLLSGYGFAGPEGHSLGFTCPSCKLKVRISKRREIRSGLPGVGPIRITSYDRLGRRAS